MSLSLRGALLRASQAVLTFTAAWSALKAIPTEASRHTGEQEAP